MELEEMKPLEDWLSQYKGRTKAQYRYSFRKFCSWAKTNDEELVEDYKKAEDKNHWARRMAKILIRWQNELLEEGYKRNHVYTLLSGVRSFFTSECITLRFKKRLVVKQELAKNEHIFSQADLQKMYDIADLRDKAILSTAVALGWSIGDFLALKREFAENLVQRAKDEEKDFIRFDWERKKTATLVSAHLTPEAIKDLDAWLKYSQKHNSKWLWATNNGDHLKADALNDILRRLVEKSGITTLGRVRFHLLRKFLMSTLSKNMDEFEVKITVGKTIPITDGTYLQNLRQSASEKYKEAYPNLSLVGSTVIHDEYERMKEAIAELERKARSWETTSKVLGERNEKLEREFKEFKDYLLNEMKLPKMIRQYETLQWIAHHVKEEIYAESDPYLQKLLKDLGEDKDGEENPSRR